MRRLTIALLLLLANIARTPASNAQIHNEGIDETLQWWTPKNLRGIKWWFRGVQATTPSTWANAATGVSGFGGITSSSGTTFHSSGGPNNAAYVSFNGTTDKLLTAGSSFVRPFSIIIVARWVGSSGSICDDRNNGNVDRLQLSSGSVLGVQANTPNCTDVSPTAAAWHYWRFAVATGSTKLYRDGVLIDSQTPTTQDGGGIVLGTNGAQNNFAQADIAEVILQSGALMSAAEESYLKRWMKLTFALGGG